MKLPQSFSNLLERFLSPVGLSSILEWPMAVSGILLLAPGAILFPEAYVTFLGS
jgi:hypothetical protein